MARRLLAVLHGILLVALTAAVLGGGWWLGSEIRAHAAPVSFADATAVAVQATPVVLGREELGQRPGPRSAARRHLTVDRRDGRWRVANAADDRRVFARTASGRSFYLRRWPLEAGDRIVLPTAALEVVGASGHLTLRDVDSGRSASFADGALDPGGEAVHPVCHGPITRFARTARWELRDLALAEGSELVLFSVGGGVNCTSRWRLPALGPEAIRITWQEGRYQVAPGSTGGDVFFTHEGGPPRPFAARAVAVDGDDPITRLILGRTVYAVSTGPDALTLDPVANRDLWRDELPERAVTEIAWAGAGLGLVEWGLAQGEWLAPGFGLALLVALAGRLRLRRRRDARELAPTATVLGLGVAALGGWVTLLTQRGEGADALLRYQLVLAAFGYASGVLVLRRRLLGLGGLVWVGAVSLAIFGTAVLLQLGAGAENSVWMRYFDKHALLLALVGWGLAALGALPPGDVRRAWLRLFDAEWLVAGAGLLLLLAMAAQLALGSEQGIAGIQPVEITKFVYVVLLAFAGMHLMEVRRRDTRQYRRSPVVALLPFVRTIGGFGLVVLSVVVGVRDFSPGIILGLVTLLWLFRLGRRVRASRGGTSLWRLLRPAVAVGLAGVVAAAAWARANPQELPAGLPQRDRILVWSQPDLHPHSGAQVLAALDRVGQGGWWGARPWFGENQEVMKVPAVQDDFIAAFLLNRFGGVAGLALVSVQLFYLCVLFQVGRRIERVTARGDFREQNAGRVLGFTLYGLAWMHAVHWAIAWCNTLGLLPVMGQPMTWISAGNSHLLGFALASFLVALLTAWVARDLAREGAASGGA